MTSKQNPQALLFIATGCAHCPSVLQSLSELVKSGTLSSLEIVNIQQQAERASDLNIRSVPWVKIGPFELTGLRSKSELEEWVKRADEPSAMGDYFGELMTSGEINKVHEIINQNPEYFPMLFELMANTETSLSVRIGIGAIVEDFAGSELLKNTIDILGTYTKHPAAHVRTDACHYLGLSQSKKAVAYIEPLLNDENTETREVAEEALEELKQLT
ncbi:MAG: thioredoxin family protein [Gammaproteobacteria bacterium]|nr:thioredoxin family protein [Gammaproteobacteria bacterium]MCW8909631.1 thioredoxin family protein [Gammaproteobacteria bacterium]MCW9004949.1 thioredoxin family protein [Gammaproteobacteria bacterium]MCW9056852.1 thioredoxin family protein [Gammaproteobacteria bacterium]